MRKMKTKQRRNHINRQTKHINEQTGTEAYNQANTPTNQPTNKQTFKQTSKQINKQTNERTNKQTHNQSIIAIGLGLCEAYAKLPKHCVLAFVFWQGPVLTFMGMVGSMESSCFSFLLGTQFIRHCGYVSNQPRHVSCLWSRLRNRG